MKLPSSLRVGNYRFKVRGKPRAEMHRNNADGQFCAATSTILLDKEMDPVNLRDTLLHESLHAVLYAYGLGTMLDLEKEAEEKLVCGLAPALVALLRNNPLLVEALTAKE